MTSQIRALYGLTEATTPLVARDSVHQASSGLLRVYSGVPAKVLGRPVPAFTMGSVPQEPVVRPRQGSQYESPQLAFGRQYTSHPQLPSGSSVAALYGQQTTEREPDFNGPPDGKGQWAEPIPTQQESEWTFENKHVKRTDHFDSENREFFSPATVETIYRGVRSALSDLRVDGKPVDLDRERIKELMGMVFEQRFNTAQVMVDYCINTAAEQIRNEIEMIQQNEALDIWVTQYTGDPAYFNMVSHSKIKLNRKRAQGIDFNMVF